MNALSLNRRFVLLFVGLLVLSVPGLVVGQVAKAGKVVSLKEGLKVMLQDQGASGLKKLTVNISDDQAKAAGLEMAGSYTVYNGLDADGNVIGSVVLINEQGKEGPLQLMIGLRPGGEIYDVGFTLFGEDKGKTANSWGFLKQFIGKDTSNGFTLGKDIDGISGATWTSTSISTAVRKAVVVFGSL
jgi:electron transport complex protein RnfG